MHFRNVFYSLLICTPVLAGSAECWLETLTGEDFFTVGDTVEFQIIVDTHGDTLQAYDFYLTFDPSVFQPILLEDDPFIPYNFGFDWFIFDNDTHGDVWGVSDNGISGFQLDYAAFVQPEMENYIIGNNIAAFFSLVIVNLPGNNDASTEIVFDYVQSRKTGYISTKGVEETFSSTQEKTIYVEGYSIYPPIADTVVYPGDSLFIDLNHHFESNVFDSSNAVWSVEIIQPVDGAEIEIDLLTNQLILTTSVDAEGILEADLILNVSGHTLFYSQIWTVEINYPVRFAEPFPDLEFLEGSEYFIHYDSLFIDENNPAVELTVWDTLITLNTPVYTDYSDDTLQITVEEDWSGLANKRIFVQEPMGRTIDTLLVIIVENVNDPPILDFFGISGDTTQGDTLILYHETQDTIDLFQYVTDLDDNVFFWTFESNPYLLIDTTLIDNDVLILSAPAGLLLNTQLIIHLDDSDTTIVKPLDIKIRSKPPQITLSEPFLVHADSFFVMNMDSAVTDEDTPMDLLTWEFEFMRPNGSEDENVEYVYDPVLRQLTIISSHEQNDNGIIVMTVIEDFDFGNIVTKELPIFYFASNDPHILAVEMIITNPDTLIAAFDLDTLIFDFNDPPDSINWNLSGLDSLESAYIDLMDNTLYIQTGSDFFGHDTLTLIATNTLMLTDTTEIIVMVIPKIPYPQFTLLPDQTIYWYSDSTFLFDLDEYIYDYSTLAEEILWTITTESDSIEVILEDDHEVFITTSQFTGAFPIIFSAMNKIEYSSADTMTVFVIMDEPPEWDPLFPVEMSKFLPQMEFDYRLAEKCDDDLTNSGDLIFRVETDTSILNAEIDTLSIVTLTLIDTSVSNAILIFSAEDEHYNVSYSDTVNITVVNGFNPQWTSIPVINFGNTETYVNGCLEEWCADVDTDNSLLDFIVESTSPELQADIVDSAGCRFLFLQPLSEIQGTFFIILRVEDQQQNISSRLVAVSISDQVLPEATLSYFITPGLSRRIHYILTSDGSVDDVTATHFLGDSLMGSLSFSLIDQQTDLQIWNAPYRFMDSGVYKLVVNLTDASDNTVIDSLSLSVALPDIVGRTLKSPSGKISMKYPDISYSEGQFFILHENGTYPDSFSVSDLILYTVESNHSSDFAFIATYSGETNESEYFSFYTVFDGQGIPIPTFIDENGDFQASIALNSHFYFGQSVKPAQNIVLPQNFMYCYPNPFNSVIRIMFFVPTAEEMNISIFNILGHRVFSDIMNIPPGLTTITWDGRDDDGQNLPTGIYFYHLSTEKKQMLNKITILK